MLQNCSSLLKGHHFKCSETLSCTILTTPPSLLLQKNGQDLQQQTTNTRGQSSAKHVTPSGKENVCDVYDSKEIITVLCSQETVN